MNVMNKVGLNADPWGTPLGTWARAARYPPTIAFLLKSRGTTGFRSFRVRLHDFLLGPKNTP